MIYLIVIIVVIIFLVGIFVCKEGWIEGLMILVVLVVVVILEGFFVIVMIVLLMGIKIFVKCNFIVCKFFVVEILGFIEIIVLDKIGILIMN